MTHSELIRTMKAQLWEEAKGKLRAMAKVEGSISPSGDDLEQRRVRGRG